MRRPRLKSVDDGSTGAYTYDGDGRRVKSSEKMFWYGAGGELLTETDVNGIYPTDFIYYGGERVAKVDPYGQRHFFFANRLGSVATMTDAQGVYEQIWQYYPYGGDRVAYDILNDPNTRWWVMNRMKFTGLWRDDETGLDHTLYRKYSSTFGRWYSPDPAGKKGAKLIDPQTWNMYAYVRNNPTTFTDPTGLVVQCSSGLGKKDMATCQSIINKANLTDKKGNYLYPKLHDVYKRLNDEKRIFEIQNAKLGKGLVGLFSVRGISPDQKDFTSATIQIDFGQLRNAPVSPAQFVPRFSKYQGLAANFGLMLAETFGHEGAHGVYALRNVAGATTLQLLINDRLERLQMGDTGVEFQSLSQEIDRLLKPTERYAEETEAIINSELTRGLSE
jgi:RHS repeat-associated protein